jgi:hypothetical protein
MIDQVLGLAVQLLCAYSQPDCQWIASHPTVPIRSAVIGNTMSTANVVGQTTFRGAQVTSIIIRPELTTPAAQAAVLAHELQHARDGTPAHGDVGDYELRGYTAQAGFFAWMDSTFGVPVLPTGSWDAATRSTMPTI